MDDSRQLTAGMRTVMGVIAFAILVTSFFEFSAGDHLSAVAVASLAAVLGLLSLEPQPKRIITILSVTSAVLMWTALIRDLV